MLLEITGFTGMSLILIAFILNQTHKWKDDDLKYDITNSVGSILMVIYALIIKSYPFLILNSVWAAVSLRDTYLDIANPKNNKNRKNRK